MNEIKRFRFARLLPAVSAVFLMVVTGCGDDFFDVKNPGAILDREYLVTTWLEARHLGRLHRWKHLDGWTHPYLTGTHHLYELVVPERFTCYPIADSECQVNDKVSNLCI